MAKKQLTLSLDEEIIAKMDKLCEKLDMSRAQVLRLLFGGNQNSIKFITEELLGMEQSQK